MTRDLYLQVKEVDIVEEPISILSRNFVLFVFFVAKTSTYKRFNNAFGGQSTSRPRAEVDSGCKITVRNEVGGDAARLRCGTRCGPLRQYYGAERNVDICRGNVDICRVSNITMRNGAGGGAVRLRGGTVRGSGW